MSGVAKSDVQTIIVWASGMIEFIGAKPVPDGSLRVCTARGQDAIEFLFDHVREQSVLHDFGGRVALRIPEINPDWPEEFAGVDLAVHALITWGDYLRDLIGEDADFEWERPHAR